jgi:hypothetical protein
MILICLKILFEISDANICCLESRHFEVEFENHLLNQKYFEEFEQIVLNLKRMTVDDQRGELLIN